MLFLSVANKCVKYQKKIFYGTPKNEFKIQICNLLVPPSGTLFFNVDFLRFLVKILVGSLPFHIQVLNYTN